MGPPDKLLYEVSITEKDDKNRSIKQMAEFLNRFSRIAMVKGELDEIGEQIFNTGKVPGALDRIFIDPPRYMIRLIRQEIYDDPYLLLGR